MLSTERKNKVLVIISAREGPKGIRRKNANDLARDDVPLDLVVYNAVNITEKESYISKGFMNNI